MRIIKSSPQLLAIYKSWLEDATSKRPSYIVLHHGLCKYVDNESNYDLALRFELEMQFLTANLDGVFPFGDVDSYYLASNTKKQHLNQARIAWVKARIADGEI